MIATTTKAFSAILYNEENNDCLLVDTTTASKIKKNERNKKKSIKGKEKLSNTLSNIIGLIIDNSNNGINHHYYNHWHTINQFKVGCKEVNERWKKQEITKLITIVVISFYSQ